MGSSAILVKCRLKSKIQEMTSPTRGELGRPKREKKRDERKERKEKKKKAKVEQGGRCDFSSPSSSPSDLQVVSRDRSQRKQRTSKFLMVGKLDFNIFHA